MGMSVEVRTHTALHVLKGAVQKVLGARWTAGVYVEGNKGRLTVKLDRKPTMGELGQVEKEANGKIDENVVVEELKVSRKDADYKWGDAIYDLFPLPASITQLTILLIPGWNVNACREEHTKTTGEIGQIKLSKTRYRPNKQLLEIPFEIEGKS